MYKNPQFKNEATRSRFLFLPYTDVKEFYGFSHVKENNNTLKTVVPNVINGQSALNRVIKKLNGAELVKKFSTLLGSRNFNTVFTVPRH